jgi:hypothetical protein
MSIKRIAISTSSFLALAAMAGPAHTQAPPNGLQGALMIQASGACAQSDGRHHPCLVSYQRFPNGRAAWTIFMRDDGGLRLSLAGEDDLRSPPGKSVLRIDRLNRKQGGAGPQPYPATGACTSQFSPEGKFLSTLSCSASSGGEVLSLRFEGDGAPVDRKLI